MTDRDILMVARALIADPRDWCQKTQVVLSPEDGHLMRRCALAAVGDALPKMSDLDRWQTHNRLLFRYLQPAASHLGHAGPVTLNDTGTHADVLAMFDAAIEAAGLQ